MTIKLRRVDFWSNFDVTGYIYKIMYKIMCLYIDFSINHLTPYRINNINMGPKSLHSGKEKKVW